MDMAIDWTEMYKKYKGKWVALAEDEKTVIASGKSVQDTRTLASKKGEDNPILLKVPVKQMTYIGYGNGSRIQLQTDR